VGIAEVGWPGRTGPRRVSKANGKGGPPPSLGRAWVGGSDRRHWTTKALKRFAFPAACRCLRNDGVNGSGPLSGTTTPTAPAGAPLRKALPPRVALGSSFGAVRKLLHRLDPIALHSTVCAAASCRGRNGSSRDGELGIGYSFRNLRRLERPTSPHSALLTRFSNQTRYRGQAIRQTKRLSFCEYHYDLTRLRAVLLFAV
jgi:hypothetical protein